LLVAGLVAWRTAAVSMPDSWKLIMLVSMISTAYFGGGAAIRRARNQQGSLPNPEFWASLNGLVYDGCAFVLSGGVTKDAADYSDLRNAANDVRQRESYGAAADSGADEAAAAPLLGRQATRRPPNSLHTAASLGDEAKLLKLLGSANCPPIDDGDARRYTPLHVACAGGYVGAARMLRNFGADLTLTNDTGLTAWELAEHLQRHEVLSLRHEAPDYTPQALTRMEAAKGELKGGEGSSEKKKSKSKRRESAPAVNARGDSTFAASEGGRSQQASRPRRSSAAAVAHTSANAGLEESTQLKAELKALGLSVKGSKAQLRQRLEDAKRGNAT
jgi:hypothetical protein